MCIGQEVKARMPATTFSRLWDRLLSEGVVTITVSELANRAGATREATFRAVHDAKKSGVLFSPAHGLYVLVPPEYRSWRTVPADWYLEDMMRHMGRDYYVSFLTAAGRHGASHHAAQVFQVVVDRTVRDRDISGVRLRFYQSSAIETCAAERVTSPGGVITLATPETCLLDLAERPDAGGGLNVILEVVPELVIDEEKLVEGARARPRATTRRSGWILSQTHPHLLLEDLRELAAPRVRNPTPLLPSGASTGPVDPNWGVMVNTLVAEGP
jgi:predicted transcriptional regulator of viral defense system